MNYPRERPKELFNSSYIPKHGERLKEKFGNKDVVVIPIRDELQGAYVEGYLKGAEEAASLLQEKTSQSLLASTST